MYPNPQAILVRREYQIKAWKKVLSLLLGVLLTMGSLFAGASLNFGPAKSVALVSALFFLAGGVYMLAWAYRSRLILDGTRIEVRTVFRECSADMSEIEGFRTVSSRYGTYKQLRLKNGAGTISVSNDFETDADFEAWFRNLPDLDQLDRETLLDEIRNKEDLGSSPEERMAALATAKTLAVFAVVVVVALALVLNLADPILRLPAAVILAIAPIAVLIAVARSPLLYAIFKRKKDPRAELAFVLIVTSFAFLLAIRGIHMVSIRPLSPIMIVLAIVYLSPVFIANREGSVVMGRVFALLFFAGLYAYSLTIAADALLDSATAEPYHATVTGKYETHGRSTSYTFYLAPWGPFEGTNRLGVSYNDYHRTMTGDQVCLNLHRGTLNAPWYQQVDCASQPAP
jgi:hypothetical protein